MGTIEDPEGFKRITQSYKVLFDIHPQMLRDMIVNPYPPVILKEKIQRAGINFMNELQREEKAVINRIGTDGYLQMDGSLLYKLIRHFELVTRPSAGWGKKPEQHAVNQGDDVERLRYLRNLVIHKPRSTMTTPESDRFFFEFRQCAGRLDRYMKRSTNVFTDEITKVQSNTVDDAASLAYHKQCENTLQLKEETCWYTQPSCRRHRINFFSSKFVREETDKCEKKEAGSKDCFMVCQGFDDKVVNKIIDLLNQSKSFINDKDCSQITVNCVESGSVVIQVSITNMTFVSIKKLVEQVQSFLNMILGISEVNKRIKHDLDIMLIPIDFINIKEKEFTLQCENCNAPLQSDSKFCHICGENIDKRLLCPKCKSIVSKEHNFCPTCGENLRQDALETTELAQGEHQIEQIVQEQNAIKELKALETAEFDVGENQPEQIVQAYSAITEPLETTELDVGENRTEEISQAQSAITEPLETTELDVGENRTEGISQAQSAITESESLTEIKELVTRIKEEGSEKFMKQLNKTLDKWKNEKVNFGLAGSSAMGKSSFMNVLIGRTGDIDERAKTSAHGNTTTSPTEYAYARQKNVSFTDFPGYGTPFFKSQAYLKKTSIDKCDYVLIFFHVVSTIDTWFAKTLDERKTKFCFVRTKLDYDIESAKYDNQEDTDPECIANSLRQTAVEAIEKEGLENPTVFVISNRRNDIGHFSDLLSHIEKVLHRTKYEAFIFEISTYTRDVIKRKHLFLCQRINSVTMRAQIEEGNEATEFNSSIEENPQKGIFQTVRYLERELMLYLDTFELNKNKSIELISQESVKQKLKFESLLLHSRFENNIKDFIEGKLEILVAEKSSNSPEKAADDDEELFREYPFLLPSRKLLSEVLDGLQEDALVIFEEFQKK